MGGAGRAAAEDVALGLLQPGQERRGCVGRNLPCSRQVVHGGCQTIRLLPGCKDSDGVNGLVVVRILLVFVGGDDGCIGKCPCPAGPDAEIDAGAGAGGEGAEAADNLPDAPAIAIVMCIPRTAMGRPALSLAGADGQHLEGGGQLVE